MQTSSSAEVESSLMKQKSYTSELTVRIRSSVGLHSRMHKTAALNLAPKQLSQIKANLGIFVLKTTLEKSSTQWFVTGKDREKSWPSTEVLLRNIALDLYRKKGCMCVKIAMMILKWFLFYSV